MLSDRNFAGSSAELSTEVFLLTVRCTPLRGNEKKIAGESRSQEKLGKLFVSI